MKIESRASLLSLLQTGRPLPSYILDGSCMLLFGIRNTNGRPDQWCDLIGYLHGEAWGVYQGTTRPGVTMLKRPINSKGTAIMVSGYYTNLYTIGLHQGNPKHPAFVQRGQCVFVRDNDRDGDWDVDGAREIGVIGANLHRANANTVADRVGDHSAGCQVVRRLADHVRLLNAANVALGNGQKEFDYLLMRAAW